MILALCLFTVLDLCSVHTLSLALKNPILVPTPADRHKASGGTDSFTDSSVFAFLYAQFDGLKCLKV